jgi:2-iminobutanoate/2-iminopropanoate deaminase
MRHINVALPILILISTILYSEVSIAKDMSIERKNYKELGEPVGPYVHAVKHTNTLYLSGLTAFGSSAQKEGIGNQVKEIFKQINTIAKAENSSLENIIKVTIFVTDLSQINEFREALFDVYGKNIPASSLVHVAGLFSPDLKIEIEAIIGL